MVSRNKGDTMNKFYTMADFHEAVEVIRQHTDVQPKTAIILGSGLNSLANTVESSIELHFSEIPHFPISTVEGHRGRLVFGKLEDSPVVVMQGRAHYYEGYSM